MNEVSFRLASAEDAPAIARLLRATRRAALPYLPILHTPEEDLAFIAGHVMSTCTIWLAETDCLAGFIAVQPRWIDHLYVAMDHHRRGIGSALLAKAFAAELKLWAFQRNAAAIRFYERHGFRIVRTTDGSDNEEREPDALLEWKRAR